MKWHHNSESVSIIINVNKHTRADRIRTDRVMMTQQFRVAQQFHYYTHTHTHICNQQTTQTLSWVIKSHLLSLLTCTEEQKYIPTASLLHPRSLRDNLYCPIESLGKRETTDIWTSREDNTWANEKDWEKTEDVLRPPSSHDTTHAHTRMKRISDEEFC